LITIQIAAIRIVCAVTTVLLTVPATIITTLSATSEIITAASIAALGVVAAYLAVAVLKTGRALTGQAIAQEGTTAAAIRVLCTIISLVPAPAREADTRR
jgi:hypothetical protein